MALLTAMIKTLMAALLRLAALVPPGRAVGDMIERWIPWLLVVGLEP